MSRVAWLIEMEVGGPMTTGEIDRVTEAMRKAAQDVEPYSTIRAEEFYYIAPPIQED